MQVAAKESRLSSAWQPGIRGRKAWRITKHGMSTCACVFTTDAVRTCLLLLKDGTCDIELLLVGDKILFCRVVFFDMCEEG